MKTQTPTHTAGPWGVQYRQSTYTIAGGGDELGGWHLVATINHDCDHRIAENNPRARADAALIAAAPDLLEALRSLQKAVTNAPDIRVGEFSTLVGDAIAKVEAQA